MNGDLYAKGWNAGRAEALREVRAAVVRSLCGTTVLLAGDEYVPIDIILDVIDKEQAHDTGVAPPYGSAGTVRPRRSRRLVSPSPSLLES